MLVIVTLFHLSDEGHFPLCFCENYQVSLAIANMAATVIQQFKTFWNYIWIATHQYKECSVNPNVFTAHGTGKLREYEFRIPYPLLEGFVDAHLVFSNRLSTKRTSFQFYYTECHEHVVQNREARRGTEISVVYCGLPKPDFLRKITVRCFRGYAKTSEGFSHMRSHGKMRTRCTGRSHSSTTSSTARRAPNQTSKFWHHEPFRISTTKLSYFLSIMKQQCLGTQS